MTNLRNGSSDRLDDLPDDIAMDNAWKQKVLDVIDHPALNGIPFGGTLPASCVLAMDETPLPYLPRSRTMLTETSQRRTVLAADKRCLTGKSFLFFLTVTFGNLV